jgi:hypothetical protein
MHIGLGFAEGCPNAKGIPTTNEKRKTINVLGFAEGCPNNSSLL